jgi:hypothetical protein
VTATVGELVAAAIEATDALGLLAEEIEDEWTFVTELVAAQTARLGAIADRRGEESATDAAAAAVTTAADETRLIADPHRAIDWLSTFPDLVAIALGEPIGG